MADKSNRSKKLASKSEGPVSLDGEPLQRLVKVFQHSHIDTFHVRVLQQIYFRFSNLIDIITTDVFRRSVNEIAKVSYDAHGIFIKLLRS